MEIFEIIELSIYMIVLIDLFISILIMNSQSNKVKNLKKIMNKIYVFFDIAFQGVKKCGVFMKQFHLWLDSFYHRIPQGVKNSGNVIRKFHTGKININLLYFVGSIFLSMILIFLVS